MSEASDRAGERASESEREIEGVHDITPVGPWCPAHKAAGLAGRCHNPHRTHKWVRARELTPHTTVDGAAGAARAAHCN